MTPDKKKIIKKLESLRDICNAKSNMAIGKGKVTWAGYANTADDALELLKELPDIIRCKYCKHYEEETGICDLYHAHGYAETWYCADGKRRDDDD